MNILNFDDKKVKIDERNKIVEKKSSPFEFNRFKHAEEYLEDCPILLDSGFRVKVAPILNFFDSVGILVTHLCRGVNLEHALRQGYKGKWLNLCREILEKFHERGFLWGDLAPRNIVVDVDSNSLYLFDFEREFSVLDKSLSKQCFGEFFRDYAFEEFSSLIPYKDQKRVFFDYLFEFYDEYEITLDEVKSKRKKELLKHRFGNKNVYSSSEFHYVQNLMSFISRPIQLKKTFHPIYFINKLTKMGGLHAYVRIADKLSKCYTEKQKFLSFKELVQRFYFGSR